MPITKPRTRPSARQRSKEKFVQKITRKLLTPVKVLAIDLETRNLAFFGNVIWSLTYSYNGKTAKIICNPNGVSKSQLPKELIRDLESDEVLKIAHNMVFDASQLLFFFGIKVRNFWDTMQCEVVIQGVALPKTKKKSRTPYEQKLFELHGVALEEVLPRYRLGKLDKKIREAFIDRPLGIPFSKKEKDYMTADVLPLIELQRRQQYILERDQLLEVALLENRYTWKLVLRKVKGINFDPRIWRQIALDNTKEFQRRLSKLPHDCENWMSEKKVKAWFRRRHIHIPVYKSKSPTVDDLDSTFLRIRNDKALKYEAKVLGDFILARELHKSVTSYGLSWIDPEFCKLKKKKFKNYVDKDGRMRPNVTQIKETGRTSMSDPNLQQLPGHGRKDYEHEQVMKLLYAMNGFDKRLVPQHRRAFIPGPGKCFVINDFSGQEIGVMAAASGERLWLDAMLRGDTVHGLTASMLFKELWEEGASKTCTFPKKCKCPDHIPPYENSKVINFQQAYGGGPTRFAKSTGTDMMDARIVVARYKRIHKKLTSYLEKNARDGVNTGESYSADPYRRRRVLRGVEKWKIENQAKNNPIQGAGANMLKLAAISVPDKYYSPLEIHDEIALEVDISEAITAARLLKKVMEEAADYITGVPGLIKADPKIQMNLMKDLPTTKRMSGIKSGDFCYVPKAA